LKFDEQLAVTGLVERCVCILSAMIVVAPPVHSPVNGLKDKSTADLLSRRDLERLEAVLDIHNRMTLLWGEASGHLYDLPGSLEKIDALKVALRSERPEARKQKLLAKESAHHAKLLETGVVVRELLSEVRASVLAIKKLRESLGEFDTTRVSSISSSTHPDSLDAAAALEHAADLKEAQEGICGANHDKEVEDEVSDFMNELGALESQFDDLFSD